MHCALLMGIWKSHNANEGASDSYGLYISRREMSGWQVWTTTRHPRGRNVHAHGRNVLYVDGKAHEASVMC